MVDLYDVCNIIGEYYNPELAATMAKLIPEHTDEEYEELNDIKIDQENEILGMEIEISNLEFKIDRLQDQIDELQNELDSYEQE